MHNTTKCYQKVFVNITCPNITYTETSLCRGNGSIYLLDNTLTESNYSILSNCSGGGMSQNKTSWTECYDDPELNINRCQFVMETNTSYCLNNTVTNITSCYFEYELNITRCNRNKTFMVWNNTISLLNPFAN